jgi:hypothetical protein
MIKHPLMRGLSTAAYPAILSIVLGGCATWRPYDSTLSDGQRLPSYLRVTQRDSSQVGLIAPFVRGDTLHGWTEADSVGVPVAEIARLDRERVSVPRTLGVVVGVPAALLGVAWVVVCGSHGGCQPTY